MQTPTIHTLPMSEDLAKEVIRLCGEQHASTTDMLPVILTVDIGRGRHTHDEECGGRPGSLKCLAHCDNSDFIVTLQYATCGWRAVYGVEIDDDDPEPAISIWMD